jgi:hypothetical protein
LEGDILVLHPEDHRAKEPNSQLVHPNQGLSVVKPLARLSMFIFRYEGAGLLHRFKEIAACMSSIGQCI